MRPEEPATGAPTADPEDEPSAQPTAAAAPEEPGGHDFIAEARTLFRVVACQGDAPLPENLREGRAGMYCRWLERRIAAYRSVYIELGVPFFRAAHPSETQQTVLYPFGGGDLMGALVTYPDANEITTLSLERAGDPRSVFTLDRSEMSAGLSELHRTLNGVLGVYSATRDLSSAERGGLPGQLSFFLVGLAIHSYEPVALRYFSFADDGSLVYVTDEDLNETRRAPASGIRPETMFANVELRFRRVGAGDDEPVRIHRHIAANLHNDHFAVHSALWEHLAAKDGVASMTKAASYLLWWDYFSNIRDILLEHSAVMTSDSTGVPPALALAAGFEIETFGRFTGASLDGVSRRVLGDVIELWASRPVQPLGFRYGYRDSDGHDHMMILRRSAAAP